MGIIYKITCPNGKSYIGQTVQTFKKRMLNHKSGPGFCKALKEKIDEIGFDKIKREIIWEGDENLLPEMEIKYIQEYNTIYPYGYNMLLGGAPAKKRNEDTIELMINNQRELAKEKNDGFLGFLVENKYSWTFRGRVRNQGMCWNFKTKEEALEFQKKFTENPDEVSKTYAPKRTANGTGGVYFRKDKNKWVAQIGKKYIGSSPFKEEAERILENYKRSQISN